MTKYIDADALKKDISEWCYIIGNPRLLGRDEVMMVIDDFITADVEEVVRCRDCVSFHPNTDNLKRHCSLTGIEVGEDDFCSYGERMQKG